MAAFAKADIMYVFAKCHYGHSYYPTKVGHRHPKLRGDFLGETIRALKDRRIAVGVYYSAGVDTHAVETHPDWERVGPDGKPACEEPFKWTCLFSPYTDELLLPQLIELVENYEMDQLFVDTMSHTGICYCVHCRRKFKERFGIEPPRSREDPNWGTFARWRKEEYDEVARKMSETVARLRPGLEFGANWMYSVMDPWPAPEKMEVFNGDAQGLLLLSLAARYFAGLRKPFQVMGNRFLHGLGDWSVCPAEQLKQQGSSILANGGRFVVIDRLRPEGLPDEDAYRMLREVFTFLKARRAAFERSEVVPYIAILHSASSLLGLDYSRFDGRFKEIFEGPSPVRGAHQLLTEAGCHFTILNDSDLIKRISDYRAVVLPEQRELEGNLIGALREYVAGGGRVLASHPFAVGNGKMALAELFGIEFRGEEESDYAYIDAGQKWKKRWARTPVIIRGKWAKIEARGADVLAWKRLPLGEGRGESFGWGVAPAQKTRSGPAVTLNRFGKGRAIFIAAPVFSAFTSHQNPSVRELVLALLRLLDPKPLVSIEGPRGIEIVLTRSGQTFNVHLVNRYGERLVSGVWSLVEQLPTWREIRVRLRTDKKPKRVVVQPEGKPLHFTFAGGLVECIVPSLHIHACVQVET